jgi:hypothetical protein
MDAHLFDFLEDRRFMKPNSFFRDLKFMGVVAFSSVTISLAFPLVAAANTGSLNIPSGLPAARENSAVGVLGSAFYNTKASEYQKLLDVAGEKTYGLSKLSNESVITQAEQVYYLETILLGLIQQIGSDPKLESAPFEKKALLHRAKLIYADTRYHGERLFEIMIREIDKAKPGTSGIQLRTEGLENVLYTANHRVEYPLTEEERNAAYAEKLRQFEEKGGSPKEIFNLTRDTVKSFDPIQHIEFVSMPNENGASNSIVRATKGSAGHILMAEGKVTNAAGGMVFVTNIHGEILFVIISSSSGSYKPDAYSVLQFSRAFSKRLGILSQDILLTKGEPHSAQIVKIMMKVANKSETEIKAKMDEIKLNAKALSENPTKALHKEPTAPTSCNFILNAR